MERNWFNKTHVKIKCPPHETEQWPLPISDRTNRTNGHESGQSPLPISERTNERLVNQDRINESCVVNQISYCGENLKYSSVFLKLLPAEGISTRTPNTEYIVEGNSHTNSHEFPASLDRVNDVLNSNNNFQMGNFDTGQSGGNFDSGYSTQTHRQFPTGMSMELPNIGGKREGSHPINSHKRTPPSDGFNQAPTNNFQSGHAAIVDQSNNFDLGYSTHTPQHLPSETTILTLIPEYKMEGSVSGSKNERTTPGDSSHIVGCAGNLNSGNIDSGYYPSESILPSSFPVSTCTCILYASFL